MKNNLYIVWSGNNELGIPIIDEQHRGIVSTINSFHYFIQIGQGYDVITSTITMLQQYSEIHFKTEEALIAKSGYPAFDEHVKKHKLLIEKTKIQAIEANIHEDPKSVLNFLKEWWLGHINTEDRKYAPFLIKLMSN